jgi:RNA polymerase sigma-70 factor (ECF subfamily)
MNDLPADGISQLLELARTGDAAAQEQLFALCREQLYPQAKHQLDSQLRIRVDASDVVQQTLLKAQRDLPAFQGQESAEWWAWIRRILENNIAEEVRKHMLAQKRDLRRDQSLDDSRGDAGPLKQYLAGQLTSPSQKAMRREARRVLKQTIETLPAAQREAIRMRYLQEMPLSDIAEVMGRSELAVGGLLKRGLQSLRKGPELKNGDNTDD